MYAMSRSLRTPFGNRRNVVDGLPMMRRSTEASHDSTPAIGSKNVRPRKVRGEDVSHRRPIANRGVSGTRDRDDGSRGDDCADTGRCAPAGRHPPAHDGSHRDVREEHKRDQLVT